MAPVPAHATISSIITGTNGITKAGPGNLTLSGNNTYTGNTALTAGLLVLGSKYAIQNSTLSTLTSEGNLAFGNITGHAFIFGGLNGSGNITLNDNAATPNPVALTIGNDNATTTYSGNISGNGSLTKNGTGELTLSGVNTYVGATTISSGTLQFASEASLYGNNTANWTAANLTVASGATAAFNVGGTGQFTSSDINSLAGLGTATTGFESGATIGLDTTAGNFTYANAIVNPNGGTNTLGLTKLGNNTLTLTGAEHLFRQHHGFRRHSLCRSG